VTVTPMSAVMLGRALMLAAAIGTAATQVAPLRATPLFQFTADDFWLNLHHCRVLCNADGMEGPQ